MAGRKATAAKGKAKPAGKAAAKQLELVPTPVEAAPPARGRGRRGALPEVPAPLKVQAKTGAAPTRLAKRPVPGPKAEAEPVVVPVPEEPAKEKAPRRRATAEQMAAKQREISISEFFNPSKALLTTIKEAVDNSLDACEEAGILPEITIEVRDLGLERGPSDTKGELTKGEGRFVVIVEDNGPGIVKAQVPKIFGKLLYGSKFHRLKQSRGQQGIGISAAAMYGQLTTGQPIRVTSRIGKAKPAHYFEIQIDTR
jgi:DNA topoisomerase-6 subunit B